MDTSGVSLPAKKYLILLSAQTKALLFNTSDDCIICPCISSMPVSSLTTKNMGGRKEGWGRGGETLLAPKCINCTIW